MTEQLWYATETNGSFQAGRYYRKEELGVVGRMAAKVGYLVPVDPTTRRVVTKSVDGSPRAVRPHSNVRSRRGKGVRGGEASAQAGGGEDVRDSPGPQGRQEGDGSGQPEGEA